MTVASRSRRHALPLQVAQEQGVGPTGARAKEELCADAGGAEPAAGEGQPPLQLLVHSQVLCCCSRSVTRARPRHVFLILMEAEHAGAPVVTAACTRLADVPGGCTCCQCLTSHSDVQTQCQCVTLGCWISQHAYNLLPYRLHSCCWCNFCSWASWAQWMRPSCFKRKPAASP